MRAAPVWLFELSGAYSTTRPGLRRPDVLWRALGKASVLHEVRSRDGGRGDLGPFVLLSTDAPMGRTDGAKALRAVLGDDRSGPVHDVLELLDPECMERLAGYAQDDPTSPMSSGQDGDRSRAR